MPTTDLEDLLKERVVEVPKKVSLYLFILDLAQTLRNEKVGNTISKIFSNNPLFVDEEVLVLPSLLTEEVQKKVEIELDSNLKISEMKIVYFDACEVRAF